MISMPGLLFETKRYDDAKKVFTSFAKSMKKGIIPNLYPDFESEPAYNTIDASLWFIYMGYLYYKETGDKDFTYNKLLPWFENIYENYIKGTLFGIGVDADGLVFSSDTVV
jgi:predicted glycogen debranching enzyme